MRINKYIASCGIASRRASEQLITDGKVKVNNKTVTDLATSIDEYNDTVMVEGQKIQPVARQIYIMLNKPKGCVCTVKDDKDRKTVMDYIGELKDKRLFPVGRLDYDTEGLILITNDGDLSHKLTHPSNEIPKTYVAKVQGEVPQSDLATLRNGIVLDGKKLGRSKIKLIENADDIYRYEVTIFEGKNRQVHRMFESVGKEVIFLKRVAVGELRLGGLTRGTYRYLTDGEVEYLKKY
ncbi:MAG: pseudouridine synthase [Clostridia bacterium]|nr:pseudouridine synthase [Clostridia bacterium]